MSREASIFALVVVVAAELLLYYLARTSQNFRGKLAKFKIVLEPGALLLDVGKSVKPREVGNFPKYTILAASITSLVFSAYLFYRTVIGYIIDLLTAVSKGESAPQSPLVPVIPGITLSLDILVPLLVSIGVGLVVHELFHLLTAIISGVPVESWGIGIVLIFPVAYVRVSEEGFAQSKLRIKASILCAGVMANLAVGLLSMVLVGAVNQPLADFLEGPHMLLVGVDPEMPAARAGLRQPAVIEEINGSKVESLEKLREILNKGLDGRAVFRFKVRPLVEAGFCGYYRASRDAVEYSIIRNAEDVEKYGYRVGIIVIPTAYVFSSRTPTYLLYANCQLQLLYIVNVSLAVVNSAPLVVTDGGRLISELLKKLKIHRLDKMIQWTTLALTALTVTIGLVQSLLR